MSKNKNTWIRPGTLAMYFCVCFEPPGALRSAWGGLKVCFLSFLGPLQRFLRFCIEIIENIVTLTVFLQFGCPNSKENCDPGT